MSTSDALSGVALAVSVATLVYSCFVWRLSFRPIVTAMVRTFSSGTDSTAFNLVVLNSGSLPAKKVKLTVEDQSELDKALYKSSTHDKERWLRCFDPKTVIPIIHNGSEVSCSFGNVARDGGFWVYGSKFAVKIQYQGWFGRSYTETQVIEIVDSDSFTGMLWRQRTPKQRNIDATLDEYSKLNQSYRKES